MGRFTLGCCLKQKQSSLLSAAVVRLLFICFCVLFCFVFPCVSYETLQSSYIPLNHRTALSKRH